MPKKLFSILLILPLLAGCTLPPALTSKLPFLNRFQSVDCDFVRAGILIGDENDEIAREQRDGYETALKQINENGGIDGCDLQLFYETEDDSETDSVNSRQTYQALRTLVEDDQVTALLGGTSNSASMTAASLANYFDVPILIPSAGGSHILPEDNRWGFRLHPLESAYAGSIFELVKQEFDAGVQTVIIFEDSTFGHDAAIAAVNSAEENELDVIGYYSYDASQNDISTLAKEVIDLQPQLIYLAFSETNQAQNILLALEKEKGSQNIIIVARAGGFASHTFLQNSDAITLESVEKLILVTRWNGSEATFSADTTDEEFISDFAEYSKEEYGEERDPTIYNAEAYKSVMIMAKTFDTMLNSTTTPPTELKTMREDLRQALFNYKENSLAWGSVDFSNGGQNQSAISLLQMFDGKWKVVYPVSKAETDLFFDYQSR